MMKTLLILLMILPVMAFSQDDKTAKAEKEINKYYNLLLKKSSPDQRKKLIAAQQSWLAYRKAENEYLLTIYDYKFADNRLMGNDAYYEILHTRAKELKELYEIDKTLNQK